MRFNLHCHAFYISPPKREGGCGNLLTQKNYIKLLNIILDLYLYNNLSRKGRTSANLLLP